MDAHTYKCKSVTAEELKAIKGNKVRMKKFSRHCLTFNAFENVPLSQVVNSILPSDTLHVFGNGIKEYFIDIQSNILGPRNKNKTDKKSFNKLFDAVNDIASRQSDRSIPRHSKRNGGLDLTKATSKENTGNLFLMVLCLHTDKGKGIFQKHCEHHDPPIDLSALIETIKKYLSYEKWIHDDHIMTELEVAQEKVNYLVLDIKKMYQEFKDSDGRYLKFIHYPKWFNIIKGLERKQITMERLANTI